MPVDGMERAGEQPMSEDSIAKWSALRSSPDEVHQRQRLAEIFAALPVDTATLLYSQLSLFQSRQDLSRVLLLSDLYRQYILPSVGVIMEFGTFLGRNAALFSNLRATFEPYNFTRQMVVFDTFQGLAGVGTKDGGAAVARDGTYSVAGADADYGATLARILELHEAGAPLSHIRKFRIVAGDARESVARYLADNPQTVIACAYFDMDVYEPTHAVLEAIKPHLHRQSLLVFDELNCHEFPGETQAVKDSTGLLSLRLQRSPLHPWISYSDCSLLA
jgi:hypothetical protein